MMSSQESKLNFFKTQIFVKNKDEKNKVKQSLYNVDLEPVTNNILFTRNSGRNSVMSRHRNNLTINTNKVNIGVSNRLPSLKDKSSRNYNKWVDRWGQDMDEV